MVAGNGYAELLQGPLGGGMRDDIEVKDRARVCFHRHQGNVNQANRFVRSFPQTKRSAKWKIEE
jgi:hypothetical protein